jgi:hypothetical protein
MQMSISGLFTVPRKNFDLEGNYLQMMSQKIKEHILIPYPLPKVKAEKLEIYICTDGQSKESSIRKISKTDRGKSLTYHFWIAYPKVVSQVTDKLLVDMNLEAFTHEFFTCMETALQPHGISEIIVNQAKTEVLKELRANLSAYTFVLSEQESNWRIEAASLLSKMIAELNQQYGRDVTKPIPND